MQAEALKRVVEAICSPLGIVTILCAAGLVCSIFSQRFGHRLLVVGTALWFVGTFSPLGDVAISALERDYPPLVRPDAVNVEAIVILSGYAEDHEGIPVTSTVSGQMMCRLVEGIRLYRQRPMPVIVSGGVGRQKDRPLAAIMADFLREMGVPGDSIVVEGRSRNTYENLLQVRTIVRERPFLLVATASDMRRAIAVARKLKMAAVPAPACFWAIQYHPPGMSWSAWTFELAEALGHPSEKRWTYLQSAYHEYVGYIWYAMLDRI